VRDTLAIVAGALLLAGCGGSASKEDYATGFRPINDKLVELGQRIGKSAGAATGKSDRQIEKEFGGYAKETADLRKQLDDLDPPDDLKSDHDKLASALGDAEHALEGIENAAREHSAAGARQATLDLVEASRKLRAARRRLAAATG
jgi:outer membrane murein-binding lipoprotein Lpp